MDKYLKTVTRLLAVTLATLVVGACSGGDDAFTGGEGQITISNFEPAIQDYGVAISGAVLLHEDGVQGGSIDLDRVMLGKATAQGITDTLALGYSLRVSSTPPAKTFVAFYIDSDNDDQTGEPIAGIGADHLFIDDHAFTNDNTDLYGNYYMWTGTQWLSQDSGSVGSYYHGTSLTRGVIMPISSSLGSNLFGKQDISGVLMVRNFLNSNPQTAVSTLDQTSVFTFSVPL